MELQIVEGLKAIGPTTLYLAATIYLFRKLETQQEEFKATMKELVERYQNLLVESVKTQTLILERLNDEK